MKKRIKFSAIIVALVLSFTALCACGSKVTYDERTLYVAAINKGYGIEWLENMLKAYVEKNPGLSYELTPSYSDKQIKDAVDSGYGYCNYDLIFTGARNPAESGKLADLTDVYEYKYTSGSRNGKTVAEAMEQTFLKSMTQRLDDSNYKCLPWSGGFSGLLLNYTVLNKTLGEGWENTYKLRTTNELLAFCEVLKNHNLSAFVHCSDTSQYGNMFRVWFAQYNGTEKLKEYFEGKYTDELGQTGVGPEVAHNEGVLEAAKVGQAIFGGGYSHPKSNGRTWEFSQSMFMSGQSAMFHNGDWFQNEMGKQYPNTDLRMILTPMISAKGAQLGISEEQLIALIDYVDAVNAGETPQKPAVSSILGYSVEELIEKVGEARSYVASLGDYFTAAVVEYNKMDLAKDFLKFMLSDEGQKIYVDTLGLTMAYGYNLDKDYDNYANLGNFAKSRWEMARNSVYYMPDHSTKYGMAGLEPFKAMTQAPLEVILSNPSYGWTAEDIYEFDYTYHSEHWNVYELYGI